MKIREMFQAKIDREITGVVKVGQHDEKVKAEELREYVITRELTKHFEEFFSNYAKSIKTPTDRRYMRNGVLKTAMFVFS